MAKRPKIRSNENIFKSREVKRHINYTSLTGNRQDICDPYNGIWYDCETICPSTGYIKGDVNADGNFDILDIIQNVNYLNTQIGNPKGDSIPKKKFYDPRKWVRLGEISFKNRLIKAFKDLNNINTL